MGEFPTQWASFRHNERVSDTMDEFPTQWTSFRHNGRVFDTMDEFPTQWVNSVIIPIFKKGDRENPSNYRGIALSDVLSKLYISMFY